MSDSAADGLAELDLFLRPARDPITWRSWVLSVLFVVFAACGGLTGYYVGYDAGSHDEVRALENAQTAAYGFREQAFKTAAALSAIETSNHSRDRGAIRR